MSEDKVTVTVVREARETAEELIDKATREADKAGYMFFMPRSWKERKLQSARMYLDEAELLINALEANAKMDELEKRLARVEAAEQEVGERLENHEQGVRALVRRLEQERERKMSLDDYIAALELEARPFTGEEAQSSFRSSIYLRPATVTKALARVLSTRREQEVAWERFKPTLGHTQEVDELDRRLADFSAEYYQTIKRIVAKELGIDEELIELVEVEGDEPNVEIALKGSEDEKRDT